MPITPTHTAVDKATGTKKVLVEYDEKTKEYKQSWFISLKESEWNITPINKTRE